jgi:sulfoquinovosidase
VAGGLIVVCPLGYAGFMYDYGEYVSPHAVAHDGTPGVALHNQYPVEYQKVAFDFFVKHDPAPDDGNAPDYIFYVRSGYTGSQSVVWAHWTGQAAPTTRSLRGELLTRALFCMDR